MIVSYFLGRTLDTTASGSTFAIMVPVAVLLCAAAAVGLPRMLLAIAAATIPMLIYYGNIFSHFRDSTMLLFWLGLTLGQLAAAIIVGRAIAGTTNPRLGHLVIAMVVAALAYEFLETAGIFLGLWVGAPGTTFSEAWNDVADHITKDPGRWFSALIGAAIAIVVWSGWRARLRRKA